MRRIRSAHDIQDETMACKAEHESQIQAMRFEVETQFRVFEIEAERRHEEAVAAWSKND